MFGGPIMPLQQEPFSDKAGVIDTITSYNHIVNSYSKTFNTQHDTVQKYDRLFKKKNILKLVHYTRLLYTTVSPVDLVLTYNDQL